MTDNNFTKLILRLLVAAYIIYLGYMLLTTAGASDHKIVFIIIGIFFLVADAGFIGVGMLTVVVFILNQVGSRLDFLALLGRVFRLFLFCHCVVIFVEFSF